MRSCIQIIWYAIIAVFPVAGGGSTQIDIYDAAVVRAILDSVGWKSVPVDSVATASSLSITIKTPSSRVTELNLAYRVGLPKIARIPQNIGNLPELQSLSIKGNALTELPSALTTLHKLKRMDCSYNHLKRLPDKLDSLPLQRLDASFNLIDSLIISSGGFSSLQVVIMDHNRLNSLPGSIGNLMLLRSISFASNNLTSIPATTALLSNVTTMNLDSNQLTGLPQEMIGLSQLKIGVVGNMLCSLETNIGNWLDTHTLTPDWKTAQHCAPLAFASVVSELTTGTVLHITDGAPDKAGCTPMLIKPIEPSTILFPERRVLKAVDVRFNDCMATAQRNFLITFTWPDFKDSVGQSYDVSIYYINSSNFEYIGGTVNSANFTVTVTSSRAGQYLLTTKPVTAAALRQTQSSTIRAPQLIPMGRDHAIEASFFLQKPSRVNVRFLTLQGRLVFESNEPFSSGMQKMRMNLPFQIKRFSSLVIEIRSEEFHSFRIVQL